MKSGNLNFVKPSGPLQACDGTALRFTCLSVSMAPANNLHASKQFHHQESPFSLAGYFLILFRVHELLRAAV